MRRITHSNRIFLRLEELHSRALPAVFDPAAAVLADNEVSDCESLPELTWLEKEAVLEEAVYGDGETEIEWEDGDQFDFENNPGNWDTREIAITWCMTAAKSTEYIRFGTLDDETCWTIWDDTTVTSDEVFITPMDPAICYTTSIPGEQIDQTVIKERTRSSINGAPLSLYAPADPIPNRVYSPIATEMTSVQGTNPTTLNLSVAQYPHRRSTPKEASTESWTSLYRDDALPDRDANAVELPLSVLAGVKVSV